METWHVNLHQFYPSEYTLNGVKFVCFVFFFHRQESLRMFQDVLDRRRMDRLK